MQATPGPSAFPTPSSAGASIAIFLEHLAAEEPTPGGGAAAALAGAAAAALIEMVCGFTHGRGPYEQWMAQVQAAHKQATGARQALLQAMDSDAAAYAAVAAAYLLPRGDREERRVRRQAIDAALAAAAEPPLAVAAGSAALLSLAHSLVGRTNTGLVSDLGAAGELASAALRIAALNVEANAAALKDDPRASALRQRLHDLSATTDETLAALRDAVAPMQAGASSAGAPVAPNQQQQPSSGTGAS